MNLCRELAAQELQSANQNDDEKEIARKVSTIGKNMVQYQYAVQLYVAASLV